MAYLDLNTAFRGGTAEPTVAASGGADKISPLEQFVLYLATAVGVVFSAAISEFRDGNVPSFEFSWILIVVALVIALLLMPETVKRLAVHKRAPMIVKLGLFVQAGVFWEVIAEGISKALAPTQSAADGALAVIARALGIG